MPNNFIYKNFTLDDNEELLKIVRQTKWTLVGSLIFPVILIVIPFFFLFLLFSQGTIGIILFFVILLSGLIWLARNLAIWYFKALIITNQRIIDIDQQKLFQRIVSDIPLFKIQDVFYRIKGLGQTITRIGDIQIILTDNKTKIEIENIFQPQKIQQLIIQFRLDSIEEKLKNTQLSAQELVNLVKKIKDGIGEERLKKIIDGQEQ
ncbi:MAG: hypothetical protein A3J62_03830 [Candidatus Buchananbacteria bacterium RIFCSPHIGHO2_02_FULL_38_8]|uniref:YokE-like PH domain-containing protein n=1 Tax=Candidatus Buchananbacteria bacterium RIFCSPHIGHO2_02_FULL_38_8 TaxID=1797538 RepID=A0A1G1Y749_9BACT|nr:hypothetical protein [uncultured bacterium]OGY47570.1 MAG: hypothetical protein A3J62_03830 [Candidatus Buchananbacteria bacterium RIFCSPHIGHO2_02_FULL_38_8]